MATKANWPEKMRLGETHTTPKCTSVFLINDDGYLGDVIGGNIDESQSRARQICALPKMVELLKEMSEQSLFFENENGEYEGTEYHHDATAILREIGEDE